MTETIPGIRPRLEAIADAVRPHSRVADVGSDHGRLPRLLIVSGRASWCVATEFGAGPARRLRDGVLETAEAGRIDLRTGRGLDPLLSDDRIDVLVLSGMGGATMLEILERPRLDALGIQRLVLQPQSGWARVRAGLDELGRSVTDERLVRDRGRLYTVIRAGGGRPLPPQGGFSPGEWYELGPCWHRDGEPLAVEYWTGRLENTRHRHERARGAGLENARREIDFAERALAALKARCEGQRVEDC